MKTIFALLVFALALTASARETAHESLALSDGRTFSQAKIISETPLTVVIQVGTRIHQVDKKLLPADVLAQWPIDEARAAREAAAAQRAAELRAAKQAEIARKAPQIREAVKQEAIREAMAQQKIDTVENAKRATREENIAKHKAAVEAKRTAELARARNGLFLAGFSAYEVNGNIRVIVRNVGTSSRQFDCRELRGATASGQIVPGGDVIFGGKSIASLTVEPGEQREFSVRFEGSQKPLAVQWVADTEWRVPLSPTLTFATLEEAMKQARQDATADRIAARKMR